MRARDGRRGFTIAELLVALGLLVVGLLALAGTATQLARAESRAVASERAAALLADRLERVASSPCADGAGGNATRVAAEAWSTWTVDSVHWLADSVRWTSSGAPVRSASIGAPVRCGR
ncbi:hypothetical protein J421_3984 [Gemmatirosa kalamazoonensis]|uniref:Prepilin-type N-terminal cleavage/methylation domain-containing protein n=1 Tax=Gemmatirosa kalamazoonensis TaxID=861299 RepID=W0RL70_9BACT|nr:prepilin-type N-terminal cleavage/methylation domain-containing protein [Gemmatirosa kalamazoonensis]AHG91521.1 hypothetical protein J421_3984 [Gemmatirosa kalamazoonensis]